jgi:integral membrane protein (TIGR00529 family)
MVDAACGGENIAPNDKVRANHWFRHIWEYTWPLYPGLILSADILDLSVGTLALLHSPWTLAAFVFGTVFILRKIPGGMAASEGEGPAAGGAGRRFLLEMSPFFIVVGIHIGFKVPLLVALLIGIAYAGVLNLVRGSLEPAGWFKAVFLKTRFWGFILMAFGVKYFGGIMRDSGVLDELGRFFAGSGIAPILIVILLPFVTGMISGITIVYVSTAFPVLLAVPEVAQHPVPYMVLAFGAGFLGTLLSPIHACLVLGNAYFKGSLARSIAGMALPSALVLGAGVAWYFAVRAFYPVGPV